MTRVWHRGATSEPGHHVGLLQFQRFRPSVETAAGTTLLPLRGGGDTYFYVDGRPPATDADRMNATVSVVTDDYFTAMRIPVKSGRPFTGTDRADGPGVMIINETLARRLFPGGNAVGERLVVDFGKPFRGQIVGVVSDVRLYGQANDVPDQMYFPIRQPGAGFGATRMRLVARVPGDASAITPQVRATAAAVLNPPDPPARCDGPLFDPAASAAAQIETGLYDNVPGADLPLYEMVLDQTNLWGNRHLRDVLRAKGYDVTYREVGANHDWVHWRAMLADGLMTLLKP